MSYTKLLKQVKTILKDILERNERKSQYRIVVRNWKIGQTIFSELFEENKIYATRNEHLFDRLSKDIGKNKRFLQYSVQFYKSYLKPPKDCGLTWTHYQYLLGIRDPKKRSFIEKRILKEGISSSRMKEFMAFYSKKEKLTVKYESDKIVFTRGIPYTYRVTRINYKSKQPSLMTIDLGFYFDIHFPLTQRETYQPGQVVQTKKSDTKYCVFYKKATHDVIYTYKACIENIIDADTFKMHIDCGFKMWTHQKIRLRGIDAPERMNLRGKLAKQFVEKILKNIPYVVIRTYGTDSFGRYLADVFYVPEPKSVEHVAQNGIFLNQQLLDSGHAMYFKG